ncbi:MAG: cysteine--tRNA ligase [Candidatus Bilamarchaeaceae archaeon]
MQVYDSVEKKFVEFTPLEDNLVIMYVCGLTPYDQAHIGHARTYVAFDVIKRYLEAKNYQVFHIQNITDVDDKIINRCKHTHAEPKQLTEKNHAEALSLFDKLGIKRADVYPRVTEHIKDVIELIKALIEKGYAYETATGVYFDVSQFADYGKLSGQRISEMRAGARIPPDETKKDALDFAIWKKTNGELIEFDSPWGRGRPGWHIECSALALKYIKSASSDTKRATLDIHGGARDLIFPHHENEIAQSESVTRKPFSKYWLHTGFLTVRGEKMSKSLGNFITIKDALERYHPMALRIFYLKSHYRSPVDYEEEAVAEGAEVYNKIKNTLLLIEEALEKKEDGGSELRVDTTVNEFYAAMDNDFDTPAALAALFKLMKEVNIEINKDRIDKNGIRIAKKEMEKMLNILGIIIEKSAISEKKELVSLAERFGIKANTPEEAIEKLIDARERARKGKNYALSDEIRAELRRIGIILEDKVEGIRWRVE